MEFYDRIGQMEPLWPKEGFAAEKSVELVKRSHELTAKLHPITAQAIARLLELMNSYYSNLIEGNITRPLDIEKAQKGDYSTEPKRKALQQEAEAHIEVQREFETRVRENPTLNICTAEFLCDIHREFYNRLPKEFRRVLGSKGKEIEVLPGELRKEEVVVGEHIPPAAKALPQFLERFAEVYEPNRLSSLEAIIGAAASHHRLAWIHPFQDGNGRVVRLFTHLYFIRAAIDGKGLWAISRGLARKREEYYTALEAADTHRLDNYDGRGNLSQKGLHQFIDFFLDVAIDQVTYMSEMLSLDTMEERLRRYARLLAMNKEVPEAGEQILVQVFYRGEVPRSEISMITGMPERSARRVTDALKKKGLIVSDRDRSPWRLHLSVEASNHLLPSLFP
jgi:Fic family protein